MSFIYLIGEIDNDNRYKIGVTKNKNINERKNELQTGNSNELYIREKFETNEPYKLEKMLHRHYSYCHLINEWFSLNKEECKKFINVCKKYQTIIDSLKNNPFFNKKSN